MAQLCCRGWSPPCSGEQGWSRVNPRAEHSREWSWSSLPLNSAEPHHIPWSLQPLINPHPILSL